MRPATRLPARRVRVKETGHEDHCTIGAFAGGAIFALAGQAELEHVSFAAVEAPGAWPPAPAVIAAHCHFRAAHAAASLSHSVLIHESERSAPGSPQSSQVVSLSFSAASIASWAASVQAAA